MLTNVSLIEATWTVIALVGIYFSALNAREALHDFRALGGKTNGRRTIATDHLRREVSRIFVFVLYSVIGVIAGLRPPPPVPSSPFIAIILIFTSLTLVVNSIFDRRSRLYLMQWGIQARDESGRFTRLPETQNQREDRQFGEERRNLEQKHLDDK